MAEEPEDGAAYQGLIQALFPKATRIEPKLEAFPVYPVYQLQQLLGYAYESNDLYDLVGFSGKPIKLMIGLEVDGRFSGVRVLDHHEPVFLHGLGEQPLFDFVKQYKGRSLRNPIVIGAGNGNSTAAGGPVIIDGVTKATVSVVIINDTVLSASLQVARAKLEGFAQQVAATPKTELFEPLSTAQLLERGYLQHWRISREKAEAALGQSLDSYPSLAAGLAESVEPDNENLFSELYFAYLSAPIIGRNLLGDARYQQLLDSLKADDQVLAVFSRGPFLHVPETFTPGSVPRRLSLQQQGLSIELRDLNQLDEARTPQLPFAVGGMPRFERAHLFRIRGHAGFNPGAEAALTLNVNLARNPLIRDQARFSRSYQLDAALFDWAEIVPEYRAPLWLRIWQQKLPQIAILVAALLLLSGVFVLQRRLSHRGALLTGFRTCFLGFTLFYIGIYAQGQLSVVNIYSLLLAVVDGFDIRLFLLDPIIFILWSYTFISLFLWGRGLYCGWLCPFGALQELLSWVALRLKIKQWRIPERWHRRLVLLKYPILVGLVATAFVSLTLAEQLAEIEPFKTSMTLVFVRHWPFVFYALLLLGLGMFIHKFYCRYLCPLGAALAIIGKLRRFSWLDRIELCGSPCQRCKHSCGIDAIKPDGAIDYDECIQCLECVVILQDPGKCVDSLQQAKRSQRAAENLIHRQ
ncbi:MAG: NosR/NirI family nitrous oxide reductase transcriptional regulator [Motiliproteus sp.]|jgi:NosR/NirI family nitrous oxide reductase transcriptional regulator